MPARRPNRQPPAPLTVLLAPCGFKEGLDVEQLAMHMARGVRAAAPDTEVLIAPMADGGEGFARAITRATDGTLHPARITGPLGEPVMAEIGLLGRAEKRTAVIDIASAAGLRLIPPHRRDPTLTTSYGVGELILVALDLGAERLIIGCGDSGVNDAGVGMAEALGLRFLDGAGRPIGRGGAALERLATIDGRGRESRLAALEIDVAVNWQNRLLGERGVATVYGPQKGATPAMVARMEAGLGNVAKIIQRDLGIDVANMPGAGASGGLGAGLHAFCGARLVPRFDLVSRHVDIDAMLARCDVLLSAEGCIDRSTATGKMPAELARRARLRDLPVIVLAGSIGDGAEAVHREGIGAYVSILDRPRSLADAMAHAGELLERATEQTMRLLMLAPARSGNRAADRSPAEKCRRPRRPRMRQPGLARDTEVLPADMRPRSSAAPPTPAG